MTARRSAGASRSLWFINTLLLSSAIALPAMAQIEEVVVTAQKRTEDVQSVPIAVTAFTGQDLKTRQINQFKDLEFHAPNVNYTAGNFGGVDFSIRGIGITAVGYDSESGVAINFDEVYLNAPQLTEGSFYDLSGVEILAGPQSTLYGRGATGGVVNVNIMKPDLENASVQVIGDYGNFNASKVQGVVNIPILTDQLGLRVAGEWDKRDGFVTNIFNGDKVDDLNQYSVRPTLRWQPTEKTTVDFTGEFTKEDDSHMRADKQLCTTDPTGVLGCLPTSAATQPVNPNSTLATIASSQQGLNNALAGGPLAGLGTFLGLYNIQAPPTFPPGFVNPSGDREISTDFNPRWQSQDNFLSLKWKQTITPWLDSTMILGYDHDSFFSQQSYNNIPGQPLPLNANTTPTGLPFPVNTANCLAAALGTPNLNCAEQTFLGVLTAFGPPGYAANYAPFFLTHPGQIPISGVGNLGITGGNFTFTPNSEAFDQSDGESSEYSGELRFNTNFKGPLNAMIGLYYLHTVVTGDYFVNASTLDYPGIILGGLGGLSNPACFATGCIQAPSYYHNVGQQSTLTSKAVFGEVYYDVIPDTLKLTGGLRVTNDDKFNTGRILLFSGLAPIGTTSESFFPTAPGGGAANPCVSATNPTGCPFIPVSQQFTAWTGRGVVNWTPKLDFTDQTMVYLSYATGYKAGGANPNIEPGLPVPQTYAPENIISYELGTKNLIFNNSLQANGSVYYYNYRGLQVSTIQYNTSVNDNIPAHVWGLEGNFVWQATDKLQFGLNFAHEESSIQNASLVNPADPTGGNQHTLLIKDDSVSATTGENCVLFFNGAFPGLPPGYVAPSPASGGINGLSSVGIPNVAFGSCNLADLTAAAASRPGYLTPTAIGSQTFGGQAVSLNGNSLQNAPQLAISANVQYTQPLPGDYSLTARSDVHWQTHFWTSIFENGASFVGSQYIVDASLQLNPSDDTWYLQGYIKNITNQNNLTGQYVSSQTSGLYTNAFYGDPRTYGVELGLKFE